MSAESQAQHPAAEWAAQTDFSPIHIDCTTAVVLKILDGKCKMLPGEMAAVMAVYDVVKDRPNLLFEATVHAAITQARSQAHRQQPSAIHALRREAEARIPKPVMKAYKALLREGLFG